MQPYHEQLAPKVLPYLECFESDFLDRDREALEGFEGTFILGVRETGTNILRFGGPWSAQEKTKVPLGNRGVPLDEIVQAFVFQANRRFFIGENGVVREVSREEAMDFYEAAKAAGETFFA